MASAARKGKCIAQVNWKCAHWSRVNGQWRIRSEQEGGKGKLHACVRGGYGGAYLTAGELEARYRRARVLWGGCCGGWVCRCGEGVVGAW